MRKRLSKGRMGQVLALAQQMPIENIIVMLDQIARANFDYNEDDSADMAQDLENYVRSLRRGVHKTRKY